jgi:hypothetical protein
MITLVTEKINDVSMEDFATLGDSLTESLESIGWLTTPIYWGEQNKQLLSYWVSTGEFNIIERKDFSNQENPFYLVVFNRVDELMNEKLWDYISTDTVSFLKTTNIPILLFYALEMSASTITETAIKTFVSRKVKLGLTNEVIILSLSSYYNTLGEKLKLSDIDPEIENVTWVPSVGFLDAWNVRTAKLTMSPVQVMIDYGNTVSLDQHILENKTRLGLCLNNLGRENRVMLTQAVHSFGHQFKEILTSQRYDTNPQGLLHTCSKYLKQQEPFTENEHLKRLAYLGLRNLGYKYDNTEEHMRERELLQQQSAVCGFICKIVEDGFKNPSLRKTIDSSSDLNRMWDESWYKDSWCSVITETHCNSHTSELNSPLVESPMLTEKILKPMLNHHPFVVFGHCYTHRLLQELGFRTFEQSWFNLPKDGEIGNITMIERLYNLVESFKYLSGLSENQLAIKWESIKPDLVHNRNLLLTNNWARIQASLILNR